MGMRRFGQVVCLHFGHDICPVNLDRPGTDIVFAGDQLIGQPCDESVHDLTLALTETRYSRCDVS